jgi:hypothetical protein
MLLTIPSSFTFHILFSEHIHRGGPGERSRSALTEDIFVTIFTATYCWTHDGARNAAQGVILTEQFCSSCMRQERGEVGRDETSRGENGEEKRRRLVEEEGQIL